ncbi:MAG TPA: outer membrane protein assembly factor BamE [Burkholderiaceae bacterium]|nr:outer membrane protein assembly factor BamE [Burkholderiaceae bacterium]
MRLLSLFAARRVSPLLILGLLALGGCQSMRPSSDRLLGVITPYKIEIVQGNVVTKEQAALIRPGMSRQQVRDVLGSPLLTDVFHANRWDYVFTIRRQGAEPQTRRVVVRFEGDSLKSIDTGGELPTEHEFITSIDTFKPAGESPTLELSAAQIQALPVPPKPTTTDEAVPVGPTRSYPPLEAPQ